MTKKSCGTCEHFFQWPITKAMRTYYETNPKLGSCRFPIKLPRKKPSWLRAVGQVSEVAGKRCPVWKVKEPADG